jgi:hypothetical protein
MKPLANGGIGDTETIPASSTPRLVFSHLPAVLVLAPSLDPQTRASSPSLPPRVVHHCSLPLRPRRHSSCQDTLASKPQAISFPLRAFACVCARCLRSAIVLPLWPLTILLSVLFPPRLLAVVASRFPLWLPIFLLCLIVSSCAPCRVFSPSPSPLRPPYPFHPLY